MRKHGVRKLVVQTTYGVGSTRDRLRWMDRLFFKLILAPQIACRPAHLFRNLAEPPAVRRLLLVAALRRLAVAALG